MQGDLRKIPHPAPRLVRDWRVKTLVPVIVLNLLAFAILYFLMYHFAVSNLVKTREFGAEIVAREVEAHLADLMHDHSGLRLANRIQSAWQTHDLAALNVYDPEGRALLSAGMQPRERDVTAARRAFAGAGSGMRWGMEEGKRFLVFGSRPLENAEACRGCHNAALKRLGVIQVGVDLTDELEITADRVRNRFLMAGAAWAGMLGLMFWAGGVVIGRPLRQIRRTIAAAGSAAAREDDLDGLADRLDRTLWEILERQRAREEDVSHHMARAERLAALGELAAGLTHEIKNPLAGIIAATEVLRDQHQTGAEQRELTDQMLAELRRVTSTVESLLRLAKPQPPHKIETDLRTLARDLVVLFRPRCRKLGISLELDTAESLPAVPLDQGLITQVIVNLLTNSIQATPSGGTVRMVVAPFPRHDGVLLAVTDTGAGIDRENMDRIFDPFFTTKQDGTGLGLAISRQIVEQHDGTMGVESEPGKGTRVVILLPRIAESEVENGETAAG